MLSSRKTLEPRGLQISTSRAILLSQSGIGHRPPSSILSFRRDLSWGSKHKDPTSRVGKVWKGSSTQDLAGKILNRKQIYRSTFWGNHHLRSYLPKYVPIHEWRFSSSWGNKPETHSRIRNNAEANEEEDWYSRWEKQKLRQYDEFMKNVEHDPFTALFGKSWLNFGGEYNEPRTARTSAPDSPKGTSMPKTESNRETVPSGSKSNNTKVPVDRDIGGRQSKSETIPIHEHDQGYEIDPITNRKVLKASPSPASTLGHNKPQVKDGEKDLEPFYKRWTLVPRTPSGHRFVMVEHAQVLSSSNPPSKDNPPIKPQNTKQWPAQEGFGGHQEPKADLQHTLQTHDGKPNRAATKIESALDRHLSSKSAHEKERSERPRLQYKPEENKTEDIDLLRPSDVRASAGFRGNAPKETDIEKQARRKKLEDKYESCSLDRASQSAGKAASDTFAQKREDRPERKGIATELRFGSWLKETLQDAKPGSKEALENMSATWVNKSSDARNFDLKSIDQISDLTPPSNNVVVSESSNSMASEAQVKATDKASKLKAQIVPFKAKLDAMKADYDFLRQEWLHEVRRAKEQAAKKEEEMKAQKIAKRAREIHEEEIETQKVAMEAMEIRSGNRTTNTAEAALVKSVGNDDVEEPAPRRLQSFLQGEGDMASNVHEFAGRDRWYKRKAPHAMDADDAEVDAKFQKLASDRALICEIRGIYEDTYGTIDTKHRQPHVLSTTPAGIRAGVTKVSKRVDKSEIADALAIIQKLFAQLREAQSIIQGYRSQTNQVLDPNDQNINMSATHIAFKKSVMQILRTSLRLARVRPRGITSRVSGEANAAVDSKKPTANSPPSTTEPKPTNFEPQKATKLHTYCILAYDSATESVESVAATMVAPFSKEESLLPLDALNRLSNPSKFLPHVTSLGAKGYEPVSGTTNILVFKRKTAPPDLEETEKTDAMEKPTPVRNTLDHMPVVPDSSISTGSGNSSFNPATGEGIYRFHQPQLRGILAEQQKAQARKEIVEKIDRVMKEARETAADSILKEKQPFEIFQKQQIASSASPSNTTSDMVHRQERVFSGSRRGRWVEHSFKSNRSKRAAAGRRRRTLKRMLMAGAFTAACCYCVGVGSEMMRG